MIRHRRPVMLLGVIHDYLPDMGQIDAERNADNHSNLQNLLALILRPLKLGVTPARLRRVRIVVLKITHAPYVLFIWAFEILEDYFSNAKNGSRLSSSTTLRGPSVAALGKRSRQGQQTSRLATKQGEIEAAPEAASNISEAENAGGAVTVDADEDLKSLVIKLMAKVERLSDQIAAQK